MFSMNWSKKCFITLVFIKIFTVFYSIKIRFCRENNRFVIKTSFNNIDFVYNNIYMFNNFRLI